MAMETMQWSICIKKTWKILIYIWNITLKTEIIAISKQKEKSKLLVDWPLEKVCFWHNQEGTA